MRQGEFVWYELCTSDPEAAAEFYAKVVGWTVKDAGLPGMDYRLVCVADRQVGGIMTLPAEQMPPRPVWLGHIAADDVDAKAAEITAEGGNVHKAPQDIPNIGRFAVVSDPQGAVFILFKDFGGPAPALSMMQTGSIGWHELHSTDWTKAVGFYERMFGWSKDVVHDMGPMGTVQMFKASGSAIGGMMTDGQARHPYWLYYFVVDDIDAGLQRIEANGGTLLSGPQAVPGGAWIVNAKDPQGAVFALVAMKKS